MAAPILISRVHEGYAEYQVRMVSTSMPESKPPKPGTVTWRDLTVQNAEQVRDFYVKVVGWSFDEFEGDFFMKPPGEDEAVASICHATGPSSNLPPQWLLYIAVDDLDERIRTCLTVGGTVIDGPRRLGAGRFCVVRDPAGAAVALFQPGK